MDLVAMQKHAWQKHRERVRNIRTEVNHESPALQLSNMLRPHQLKTDAGFFSRMVRGNTELLQYINRLTRTQGVIDSFPKPNHTINPKHKRRIAIKKIRELEKINAKFGQRILNQKAELNTFPSMTYHLKLSRRRKPKVTRPVFQAPAHILAKYGDVALIKMPRDCELQRRFLRPRIYLDLAIKNLRSLGRLVFELYTEASPQIVLEFVRICKALQNDRFRVLRIFPGLWLEGEVVTGEHTLACKPLEYDMRALEHDSATAVLSYSKRFLKGFCDGFVNFSLSFKPLSVLQGRRVAFGRLVNGLKILDCMQDYGTKNGKLRRDILVTGCGMMQ